MVEVVEDSCCLKLSEDGEPLQGDIATLGLSFGQKVWCYYPTFGEKTNEGKAFFKAEVIGMSDHLKTGQGMFCFNIGIVQCIFFTSVCARINLKQY